MYITTATGLLQALLTVSLTSVHCQVLLGDGGRIRKREAELAANDVDELAYRRSILKNVVSNGELGRYKRQTDSSDWYDDWSNWYDWERWSEWNTWKDWVTWNDWYNWKSWQDSWSDWNSYLSYTTERYESEGLSTMGIVGIVAGCFALSCCIGCCKAFCCSKKSNQENNAQGTTTIPVGEGQPASYSTTVTTADGRTMRTHQVFLGGQPLNTTTTSGATAWAPPEAGYPAYPPAQNPTITVYSGSPTAPSAPGPATYNDSMPPPPSYDQAVDNSEYVQPPPELTANQLPTYNDYIRSSPFASQERIDAISTSQVNISNNQATERHTEAGPDTPLTQSS